jgi:hypothetical protein
MAGLTSWVVGNDPEWAPWRETIFERICFLGTLITPWLNQDVDRAAIYLIRRVMFSLDQHVRR